MDKIKDIKMSYWIAYQIRQSLTKQARIPLSLKQWGN